MLNPLNFSLRTQPANLAVSKSALRQGRIYSALSLNFSNHERIGGANQRKLLCRNDFSWIPGAPDADRLYAEFVRI